MPLSSPIRRLLVTACVLPLVVSGGCKDQRGDAPGPSPGIMSGGLTYFTSLVTLSIHNYHNSVVQEVLGIVLNGTPTPVFTSSCFDQGEPRRILPATPGDPTRFRVAHATPPDQPAPFVIYPNMFSPDICAGFFRYQVTKEMIVEIDPTAFPDSMRFTITLPDDGSPAPGVVYQLPAEFDGTILATSGTIYGELVDIEYGGTGEITRGYVHITGSIRLEDRTGPLFFVQELDLRYLWEPPLPFSAFPEGTYEISGFTHTNFTGAIVGNPIEIQWDGFSQGTYTGSEGQLCTIDLLNFNSDCFDDF
jgi:hypothetical protein